MKWTSEDANTFLQSKDYVDTAVIPLIQIGFGTSMKSIAAAGEYLSLITEDLERQLKGRIYLLPACTYLTGKEEGAEKTIQQWYHELEGHFKHIFFFTSDDSWRNAEEFYKEKVIYLPQVPLEHMDDSLKRKMIDDQISQIMNIFLQSWRGQ